MFLQQVLKLRSTLRNDVNKLSSQLDRLMTYTKPYSMLDGDPRIAVEMAEQGVKAEEIRQELMAKCERIAHLTAVVANANVNNFIDWQGQQVTVAWAMANRDAALKKAEALQACLSQSRGTVWVQDRKEYKRYADNASRIARELDDLIQQANWRIELAGL